MNENNKAAPAATVDTPEFRAVLADYADSYAAIGSGFPLNDSPLIAHIDAHAAAVAARAVEQAEAQNADLREALSQALSRANGNGAPAIEAPQALSDEQIAAMWRASQDQAVTGQPAPIHFARAILAASQQPAATAWGDQNATQRLRSIVSALGMESVVPDGDLTGYEFPVLGMIRLEIERLKERAAAAPAKPNVDCSGDPKCCPDNEGYGCACDPMNTAAAPADSSAGGDDVMRALRDARDLAMKQSGAARIPECGDFGAIAQNLDWAIDQLAAAPAVQVQDERAAYEAAVSRRYPFPKTPTELVSQNPIRNAYRAGWDDRAALAAKPAVVPVGWFDTAYTGDVQWRAGLTKGDIPHGTELYAAIPSPAQAKTAYVHLPSEHWLNRLSSAQAQQKCVGCDGNPTIKNSPCGVCGKEAAQAQPRVITKENAKEYLEELLWNFVDTSGNFPAITTDPRTWEHVMVYAPDSVKAAQAQPVADAAPAFPPRDMTKPAEQQGIFEKFTVRRNDGSDAPGGKHHGCAYFVLDLDHDQHATTAIRAYAASCRVTHPQLADDIEQRYGTQPPADAAPVESKPVGIANCMEIILREDVQTNLAIFARDQSAMAAARLVQSVLGAQPSSAQGEALSQQAMLEREQRDAQTLATLLRKERERFQFLHSTNKDSDGWEWGVARIRVGADGRVEYLWGVSDHSDIDAAICALAAKPAEGGA